jgi:hypothetical protein
MRYPNKKRRPVAGPCEQPVSSNDHLREVKATRTCQRVSLRMVRVQWQVEAGFVIAKLNMMES